MKSGFYLKLSSVMIVLALSWVPCKAQGVFADVNGDGAATIRDVTDLIDYLLSGDASGTGTATWYKGYLSARDYGAVGDGVTDDTEALERLFAAAAERHLAIYFPSGTYMIRRPLTIMSGMEIYGDGNSSVLKKFPAAWHKLTDAVNTGVYNNDEDHTITIKVDGISGYHVGDHCYISYSTNPFDPANAKARYCSYGEIAAINEVPVSQGKYEIKFKSAYDSEKHGVVYRHAAGTFLSTSFPLLRSWSFKDECVNVYIHDICLDGNRQTNGPTYNGVTYEPMEWANGCIHFDAYGTSKVNGISYDKHSYNHIVQRCKIINSSFDGISDQGEGGLYVKDCAIENCAMHGVHMGTVFSNAIISGNTMTGNGVRGAGVFFCQDVTNAIIDGNIISSFNHGCSDEEYGTAAAYNIIRNNQFNDITSYVFDFLTGDYYSEGGGLQISGNTISGLKAAMFAGYSIDNIVLLNNKVTSITQSPSSLINLSSCGNVIIVGNTLPYGTSISRPVSSSGTSNVINTSNSWN